MESKQSENFDIEGILVKLSLKQCIYTV
jgi:hypothetical protein